MRIISFLIAFSVLLTGQVHAQEVQKAASEYQVPTFEAKLLDVHGEDLFSYNDKEELNINIGSDFVMTKQTPMTNMTILSSLDFRMGTDFGLDKKDVDQIGHRLSENLIFGYQRFIGGSRGLSVNTGAIVTFQNDMGDEVETTNTTGVVVTAGVGYGRVVNARPLAQASAMCTAADQKCDAKKLLEIGELIGKYQAGHFGWKYKADADVKFYEALLKAIGGGNALKMQQILLSPIYNIGDRNVGWDVGAQFTSTTGDLTLEQADEETTSSIMIQQYARYAALLSDTMGYYVNQTFTQGLKNDNFLLGHPGEDNGLLSVRAGLNVDHTPQWNTQVNVVFNMLIAPEEETAAQNDDMMDDDMMDDDMMDDEMMDDEMMDGDMMAGDMMQDPNAEADADPVSSGTNYRVSVVTNRAVGTKSILSAAVNVCGGDRDEGIDPNYAETCSGDGDIHYSVMAAFRYFIF